MNDIGFWWFLCRRWFRSLFCRHDWRWHRNIHGDEIIHTGCRTVFKCPKCGCYQYVEEYIKEDEPCG